MKPQVVYFKKWKNSDNAIVRVLDQGGGMVNAVAKYAKNSRYCVNLTYIYSPGILALGSRSALKQSTRSQTAVRGIMASFCLSLTIKHKRRCETLIAYCAM